MVSYTSTTTSTASATWNSWVSEYSPTAGTWGNWVADSNTSTTATSDGGIWEKWQGSPTATSTDTVWYTWTTSGGHQVRQSRQIEQHVTPTISDREKKVVDAEKRAKQLLLDLIGEKDLETYNKTGRLFVKGRKHDYIIQKRGFVQRVEKDKITDLCVHLDNRYKYPGTDNVIALKLAIETDEDRILELANNHGSKDRPKEIPLAACM